MKINAGAAITDAMRKQAEHDFLVLALEGMRMSGLRIQARLQAKAEEDPTWQEIADYHNETLRQIGVEE